MTLTVITDHDAIRALLDPLVAADPVRHTLLATLGSSLEPTAWAAIGDGCFAVRSAAHWNVQLVGTWDTAGLTELAPLLPADLRGLAGDPVHVEALLPTLGSEPVLTRERLHRLDQLTSPAGISGQAVVADPEHHGVIADWVREFHLESHGRPIPVPPSPPPGVQAWLWTIDGEPVSLACRRTAVNGVSRVGPVYTPPALRGHGYASGVTAAATASILADGDVPVLFTDLANPTSNKIYAALGYRPVFDRLTVERTVD